MNRTAQLSVPALALHSGCAPGFGPGMGPLFGPEGVSQLMLIVVIVLVVWLIKMSRDRSAGKGDTKADGDETKADAVLRERYARGEISRDEYLQISKDLERR